MKPLMLIYNYFKQDYSLKRSRFLRLFEDFICESSGSILEYAPQISPDGIHATRFRVGYTENDNSSGLTEIGRFLDKVSVYEDVQLNRVILEQAVNRDFDLSKVGTLGIGIDFREAIHSSKVKFYFTVKDYPEKLEQILAIHPPIDNIKDYPINNMFGINMYFDGRTDIEIYPSLMSEDFMDAELMANLGLIDIPHEFLSQCKALFVSFKKNKKRVLHFYPVRPTKFLPLLSNQRLTGIYVNALITHFMVNRRSRLEPLSMVISFTEDEMLSKNIQYIDLSLYYQLRAPSGV
jgi:LynF/TruF/PatF family peptide O-prenyltransferase